MRILFGCSFVAALILTLIRVTARIPDALPFSYRYSKYPIGSCVATLYGIGILVGWRHYDDMHVIRCLWRKKSGGGLAYFNRNILFDVVEAAIGLDVITPLGSGIVIGYINGGSKFLNGRYLIQINESCRHQNAFVELYRDEIQSCPSAKLIPVIEYIREAISFQIQYDNYQAMLEQLSCNEVNNTWEVDYLKWSVNVDIIFSAFIKAVEEKSKHDDFNHDFDREIQHLLNTGINFLERLELGKQSSELSYYTLHRVINMN